MTVERASAYVRRAQPLNDPLPETIRWVATLPDEVRPLTLLQQFPRIANLLARAWHDGVNRQAYLESLLSDRRGGRRGFRQDVHNELLSLRQFIAGRYPVAGPDDDKSVQDA